RWGSGQGQSALREALRRLSRPARERRRPCSEDLGAAAVRLHECCQQEEIRRRLAPYRRRRQARHHDDGVEDATLVKGYQRCGGLCSCPQKITRRQPRSWFDASSVERIVEREWLLDDQQG